MTNEKTTAVLAEVLEERRKQGVKWGEQNHRDGSGANTLPLEPVLDTVKANRLAEVFKANTDRLAMSDAVTWADILLEEVFEALAESEPGALRDELVQVAAVAVQWVEFIDRRDSLAAPGVTPSKIAAAFQVPLAKVCPEPDPRAAQPPRPFCGKHRDQGGTIDPCRACGQARLLAEAWTAPSVPLDRNAILDTARELIGGERARTYGDATEAFRRVGIMWGAQLDVPALSAAQVASLMVTLKLVRIASSPDHEDSWIDAAGYVALGAEAALKVAA